MLMKMIKLSHSHIFIFLPIFVVYPGRQMVQSQDPACTSIYRGDQSLTGQSNERPPASFSILWTFTTGNEIKASPVACRDHIAIGSTDGTVYCLDAGGNLHWKFNTGNALEAPALILDDILYVGNLDGSFFSLELGTGIKRWEYRAENQVIGSANFLETDGRKLVYFGSYDYHLHCLDARTGEFLWKYESDNFINGTPALFRENAVFGGCDGYLHIVEVETGKVVEKVDVATYIAGSAAISGNLAYLGDYDGTFSCVDLEGNRIKWQWSDEDMFLPFIASPAVSDKRVVTGNEDRFVYCFDRMTGEVLWKTNTRGRIHASPMIYADKVLVATLRGDLLLLDLDSGKILTEFELGSAIAGNPVVCSGNIIVGAQDGNVYCIGKK
jgi:outer membrane protein assembly factor BamB